MCRSCNPVIKLALNFHYFGTVLALIVRFVPAFMTQKKNGVLDLVGYLFLKCRSVFRPVPERNSFQTTYSEIYWVSLVAKALNQSSKNGTAYKR